MSPSRIKEKVISERFMWVTNKIAAIRSLPIDNPDIFLAEKRNAASAESYLRRALEALLDSGRHILAKGFGKAAVEYKEISAGLGELGIIDDSAGKILYKMAGYRNRMVHFYDEITDNELYEICAKKLIDIESVLDMLTHWLKEHPKKIDTSL